MELVVVVATSAVRIKFVCEYTTFLFWTKRGVKLLMVD